MERKNKTKKVKGMEKEDDLSEGKREREGRYWRGEWRKVGEGRGREGDGMGRKGR